MYMPHHRRFNRKYAENETGIKRTQRTDNKAQIRGRLGAHQDSIVDLLQVYKKSL